MVVVVGGGALWFGSNEEQLYLHKKWSSSTTSSLQDFVPGLLLGCSFSTDIQHLFSVISLLSLFSLVPDTCVLEPERGHLFKYYKIVAG